MTPSIRLATENDLPQILLIYQSARQFMAENGNPTQWSNTYPHPDLVLEDLHSGSLYVCTDGARLLAVFYYSLQIEEDYLQIFDGNWLNDAPYGVIHRLAVAAPGLGIAAHCLNYGFSQCGNLRIDTHADNIPMQRTLAKNGFQRCGIIHCRYGGDRIAYQKTGVPI